MPRLLIQSAPPAPTAIPALGTAYVNAELQIPIGGAKVMRLWNVAAFIFTEDAAGAGLLIANNGDLYIGLATAAGADVGNFLFLPRDRAPSNTALANNNADVMVMNSLASIEIELQIFGNPIGATRVSIGGEWGITNSDAALPHGVAPDIISVLYELV